MRSKKTNLWRKCTASALAVAMAATSAAATMGILGVNARIPTQLWWMNLKTHPKSVNQ